jgi:hypothetical protein
MSIATVSAGLAVLVLGHVHRVPGVLDRSIQDFLELKELGIVSKISLVVSMDHYNDQKAYIDDVAGRGVAIMAYTEPKPVGLSHIWAQMKSLLVGLVDIPADQFVLRTRADVYIEKELLWRLATTPEFFDLDYTNTAAASVSGIPRSVPQVFQSRVWVPWMDATQPFWVSDEAFMGRAGDLRLLVRQ